VSSLKRLDRFVEKRIHEADANPAPVTLRRRALKEQKEQGEREARDSRQRA